MRLLPILWGSVATEADWAALTAARVSLGHTGQIKPARAVPGSPGRILAIGAHPDWLCEYAYVDSTHSPELKDALAWCLEVDGASFGMSYEDVLSRWMGADVRFVEEVEIDGF